MKIDPVVALTLMLLSVIVAATSVSVSWGYALGRKALRGVTQPDSRPTPSTLVPGQTQAANDAQLPVGDITVWSEAQILEEVKGRINYGQPVNTPLPPAGS